MKTTNARSVLVCVLAFSACASPPPDTREADLQAIAAVRDAYAAAFTAEDPATTAALFTTDGVLMDDNAQQIVGRDAIRAHLEKTMAGMETDLQLKADETVVTGDWAFDRGQTWVHIMSKDPKSTMPMIMDQGKYLAILQRQPDNSWLVARVMSNSNITPPPALAAPAAR